MIGVRSRSRTLQLGLAAAVLATVAACGGAAREAAVPSASPASPAAKSPDTRPGEPSTVEQAQAQIAAARAELAAAGAGSASTADESIRHAPEPQGTSAGVPRPSVAPSKAAPPPAEAPAGTTSCGSPCRAIASMRRAVSALCRMTGPDDTRCVDAKRTLADSQTRIAPCSC